MLKEEIKQKITDIRLKWISNNEIPNANFELLNNFFRDIYTDNQDTIFLCFTKNDEHTYYSFKASIIDTTYQIEWTVPFWFYCKEFIEFENMNVFICPNSFRFPRKRKNAIHQTNCLFCDIDDHDVDFLSMTKKDIKDYLNKNYSLTNEIMPAYVVVSGHGLHLYFITETIEFYDTLLCRVNNYELEQREKLERSLITYFKADVKCLDLPREMRLPFSLNCKNDDRLQTKLYCYDDCQYLKHTEMSLYLQDEETVKDYFTTQNHLKHSKNKNASVRQKKEKLSSGVVEFSESQIMRYYFTHKIFKTKNSTMNTILDLEDFYRARDGFEGFRKDFFFIYILRLKQFKFNKQECYKRCFELERNIDMLKEIDRIIKYQYDHDYKISNLKIHEHLKFTQFEINMFRCAYTSERKEIDKKKRLKRLSDKRKEERDFKNTKELQLDIVKNNLDMSRQDLAEILGVSIRTISNLKKQIRS